MPNFASESVRSSQATWQKSIMVIQRPIVLVAEDNPVNQRVADLLLKSLGFIPRLVDDGTPAVQAYKQERPAIILMDIMMPVMDGFHASREIRLLEFGLGIHTPIIACTALEKTRILEDCISNGIDDYIGKPFTREILAGKMQRWLQPGKKHDPIWHTESLGPSARHSGEPFDPRYLKVMYGVEELDEVLELFLRVTQTLLAKLDIAIKAEDGTTVSRIAHELKGSSSSVNAKEIAKLCWKLEENIDNWPEVLKTYSALALAFDKVSAFARKPQIDDPARTRHPPAKDYPGLLR